MGFQDIAPAVRPLFLEGPAAAGAAGLLGAVAGAETAIVGGVGAWWHRGRAV